ncbi:MAG TPA: alpha-hydroxy acid oxidase, partial [Gemmatimonadales bacterium]|nr:alpha-hydroxy acid oxidase [Gemmatimonadales bacterium]
MTKPARAVAAPRVVNVEDLRLLARRRLPRVIFDYLDGGAEGEVTLRENRRAFETVTFRPRHAVGSCDADLRTMVLGAPVALPVLLAPVGYSRVMHVDGEPAAARAAAAAGTVYILSTMSGYSLEDVKAAAGGGGWGSVWYQLYLIGGRDAAEAAIARARAAGYTALVVTIDTTVAGLRERDVKNGMTELLGHRLLPRLPFLPQLLRHPTWLAAFLLRGGVPPLANVVPPGRGPMPLVDVTTALARAAITWADLRWLRDAWGGGPIVVKGVLTGDDARRALDAGAAAVVVSNHGGRQ